ncbi:MAG: acetolactate synthase small subunit [Actinobacteria bacterium]|nr:acetolactate synthase small subunit [Actinomycetota bacterium]
MSGITTHTISVLVENRPGALARVSGLFARRGYNIDSLAVGETEDRSISRMTIVVSVDGKPLEQVTKQLHKLVSVLRIAELPHDASIERELALIKVGVDAGRRAEVLEIVEIFRAKVVDVDAGALTVEATGTPGKVAALEELLRPYGIVEMARTGIVALGRGSIGLKAPKLRPVSIQDRGSRVVSA